MGPVPVDSATAGLGDLSAYQPGGITHPLFQPLQLRPWRIQVLRADQVARGDFLWGAVTGDTDFSFAAVDAGTLRPVTLPATLRKPDSIGQLAGSPDDLAWSSSDYTGPVVWRIGSDHYDEFSSHDGVHFVQFMQLVGHYLV